WTNKRTATELLDDHRALEPPDPIPNSAVKRCIADGSVGLPHVRVGHRQAPNAEPRSEYWSGFCLFWAPSVSCQHRRRRAGARQPGSGKRVDRACATPGAAVHPHVDPAWGLGALHSTIIRLLIPYRFE